VRQEKQALLPTAPGRYELPAVEVTWWNLNTDRPETTRLPARTVEVPVGGAAFLLCGVPVVYRMSDSGRLHVYSKQDSPTVIPITACSKPGIN